MKDTEVMFDSVKYRQVLGHFPTGVAAITAMSDTGKPLGMAVGSFTSVSLDPPLVAFLPDKRSSTFPLIREAGSFCVNFLSAEQQWICRALATKGGDKFAGVPWMPAASTGSPVIEGGLGWIDCEIDTIHDAGDHFIVVGKVRDLDVARSALPLVFFQGGYGHFSSLSLASSVDTQLLRELQYVEAVREPIERLVSDLEAECLGLIRQGDEMITLASWSGARARKLPSRVGQRQPLVPPMGALLVAWEDQAIQEAWLDSAQDQVGQRDALRGTLARVRERGWSLGLDSEAQRRFADAVTRIAPEGATPEQSREMSDIAKMISVADSEPKELKPGATYGVRSISAPVFDSAGHVTMMLTLFGFRYLTTEEILDQHERLVAAAHAATHSIGGRKPGKDGGPK